MAQLDYNTNMREAFEGLIATTEHVNCRTGSDEVAIPFGRGVVAGTDPEIDVKVPTVNTETFRGISVHTHKQADSDGVVQYKVDDAVSYLTKGVIWVPATVAVNIDEPAYVIATGADAGKFTNVSTANIATGGFFRKSISAAGLTQVELNNPQS